MKNLYNYIKESEKDGKNGHYEDFVDEDTGEIVTLWVADPDPEEDRCTGPFPTGYRDRRG